MTPITPLIPAAGRLEADLRRVEEAVTLAREAARVAGQGATVTGRVTLYVSSEAAVDAIAASWGCEPRWFHAAGSRYVASTGDAAAGTEAVWVPRTARAAA